MAATEGAQVPTEEYSLELQWTRDWRCAALPFPDRATKSRSPRGQPKARMQRPAALGMRQACLPQTKSVSSPCKERGIARAKDGWEIVLGNIMTCQEKCSSLARACKKYLETAQGEE